MLGFSAATRMLYGMSRHLQTASRGMSNKISVNGVNIAYEKIGSGDKVVLLLPGALGTIATDFEPQMKGLNRKKLTIVGWEPRGYGRSIPPERDFPLDFFQRDADDAVQLMQKLGVPKFSMLGWSDGGITASIIAGIHQDKVDKLVLWGANSFVTKEDLEMYEKIRDISMWSEKMRKPMIDAYGEEYFRKTFSAWVDGFIRIFHERNGDICMEEVQKITAPTLIIHGMKDSVVPLLHPEHLNKNIQGSILDCWADGKHNLHLRFAERFNAQVEEFILAECSGKL